MSWPMFSMALIGLRSLTMSLGLGTPGGAGKSLSMLPGLGRPGGVGKSLSMLAGLGRPVGGGRSLNGLPELLKGSSGLKEVEGLPVRSFKRLEGLRVLSGLEALFLSLVMLLLDELVPPSK